MTHRDGLPRLSARRAWRGDAGHRKPWAARKPWETAVPVAQANRQRANGRASESLTDVPHRLRLPSYPADRLPDLYGSLSALLGITAPERPAVPPPRRRPDAMFAHVGATEGVTGGAR